MPAKAVKDWAMLIVHRLIARRLRFDSAMLEQARRLINGPPISAWLTKTNGGKFYRSRTSKS